MGTSQSKRDAPPAAPLIPPWVPPDPEPPESEPNPPPDEQADPENQPVNLVPEPVQPAPLRRYAAFRTALGRFASSGNRADAQRALGHWARTSTGGARIGAARVGVAIRSGGAAITGLARAGAGLPPIEGSFDIRSLAGLSVSIAVDRIVDAFCQPGILDEELARVAIGEALVTALAGADAFNPDSIDAYTVQVATLTFVAELVFVQIMGDGGRSLASAVTPLAAVQREIEIRSLIREVADIRGTPVLEKVGGVLTPKDMSALVSRLVEEVELEIASW